MKIGTWKSEPDVSFAKEGAKLEDVFDIFTSKCEWMPAQTKNSVQI